MKKEHLHLLIHEEIYRLPEDGVIADEAGVEEAATSEGTEEVQEPVTASEPQPEPLEKREKPVEAQPEVGAKKTTEEHHQESPHIPHHDLPESKPIPFAVFHESHDPAENELLHKIIDACKIPESEYKVFSNGFDQAVKFKKALVFVPEAKAFYTPIPYKGSEFLCSRPLSFLVADKNEKAKLWEALQSFVL